MHIDVIRDPKRSLVIRGCFRDFRLLLLFAAKHVVGSEIQKRNDLDLIDKTFQKLANVNIENFHSLSNVFQEKQKFLNFDGLNHYLHLF